MKSPSRFILSFMVALLACSSALATTLTNADIIKMVQANLAPDVIQTAILNSEPNFDTSAQGLIDLSSAKVPTPVVQTMIRRAALGENTGPGSSPFATAGSAAPHAAAAAQPASNVMSPSEIVMVDGDKRSPMRYLNPQVRTAARALGFGGVASYAVLRNRAAIARTKNREPEFIVSVPDQAQVESYLTLAHFAVRPNNSREVMIGGGFMSYSTGIHPDRVVPVSTEKLADQSAAPKGFTVYRVKPAHMLVPGEYAVILYTGEMQSVVATWFSGTGNSYFDFGVDP